MQLYRIVSFGSFLESDLISPYNAVELIPFSIIGLVGGVLGAGFNALNTKITTWRMALNRKGRRKWVRIVTCMVVSLFISSINILTPLFAENDCVVRRPRVGALAM